jgi:nucleoside-diphosphate-sugar epimerase
MRILVIGGTGFIGAHVIGRLIETNHAVAVFARGSTQVNTPTTARSIVGERRNLSESLSSFREFAPDVVIDLLAYTEQDAVELMDAFRKLAYRVVVISSMDVYAAYGRFMRQETGGPSTPFFDEDAPLRKVLYPYRKLAQSCDDLAYNYEKILVERVVMNDAQTPGTVLRLPAVYGPGDEQHRLFEYLKRMDDKRPAILLGKTKARWRWTRGYVENVAAAIALAATDESAAQRIYNVGEVEALAEAEWVESIGRAARWNGRIAIRSDDLQPPHLQEQYDWAHDLYADTSRMRSELGFSERIPQAEALRQTVAWERAHPPSQMDQKRFDYAAEDATLLKLSLE